MKLQEKNKQYSVTLPRQIILALQWQKGDHISYKLQDGKIVLGKE